MSLLEPLRRRLGWKLFLSYMVIVIVGVAVLAGTAELHAPTVLNEHSRQMQQMLGERNPQLVADFYATFQRAVTEVLIVAASFAVLAAVLVSIFVTRRIVRPVQSMMETSQRIAAGEYHERVGPEGVPDDELGRLAEAFNRMAASLEQTEQRRMALIGDVAHELRTPLSSIKSVMEGLTDGVLPPEPETFQMVQTEVSRLQRLVHDLQELSRAEAGEIALERESVAVATLVEAAAERLAPQFQDKGVRLQVNVPDTLPPVQVDPNRITQVLLNLIGNALQYTPPDGEVSVEARGDDGMVAISVTDTGIGIPSEHLPHLFERFYRVDKSRSRLGGGSGIGLTIAKHLVDAHGGHIWAESAGRGEGSTFTVTLPTRAEEDESSL